MRTEDGSMRQMAQVWIAALAIVAIMVLSGCGSGMTNIDGSLLTSITVTSAGPSLAVGATRQFTAIGQYEDKTTQDITNKVTWTSSDTSKATISDTGMATAIAPGTTSITAKLAVVDSTVALTILLPPPAEAQWAQIDMAASGSSSDFHSVSVASDGSIYAAGSIDSAFAHDLGNGITTGGTASTGRNIALVKYDSSGAAQWVKTTVAGAGYSYFNSVTAATDGSVYAAGYIDDTRTFDFGDGVTAAAPSLGHNIVLVKYESSGTARWVRTAVSGTDYSSFNSVAAASDGSVYASGYVTGTGTYDFGNGVTVAGPARGSNIVLVKYDSSGNAQWAKTMVSGDSDSVFDGVAASPDGAVYASGYVTGTGTYDFGNDVTSKGILNFTNSILVKYDSNGTAQWVRSANGMPGVADAVVSMAEFYSVAAAPDGSVYAAGYISSKGPFSFGNNVTITVSSIHDINVVVLVKYDPSGTAQWARTVAPGSDYSEFRGVSAASDGSLYAAGMTSGDGIYDFGNGVMFAGSSDRFMLVKYSSAGTALWVKTVNLWAASWFSGVSAAPDGSVCAAGTMYGAGTADFGNSVTATGYSFQDFLLVKYQ